MRKRIILLIMACMELRKQGDTETIRYYDLILDHTEPIESVEINYKFLLFKLGEKFKMTYSEII